jgi:hypothetical protein
MKTFSFQKASEIIFRGTLHFLLSDFVPLISIFDTKTRNPFTLVAKLMHNLLVTVTLKIRDEGYSNSNKKNSQYTIANHFN